MQVELSDGEHIVKVWRANRSSRFRAVGGRLVLTTERVCFVPHLVDRSIGAASWEVLLEAVVDVGLVRSGWNPLNGALRSRVCISGSAWQEAFVVTQAASVVETIGHTLHGGTQ
jgi:hypothetical protein